jgi:hypothetical protein
LNVEEEGYANREKDGQYRSPEQTDRSKEKSKEIPLP